MPLGGFLCWVRYPFVRRLCLITKETEHRSYFNTVIYHSRYFWRPTNNNERTLFFITFLCHITAKLYSIKLLLQLTMLYTFQCPLPSLQQWQHLWKDDLKPSFKCHPFLFSDCSIYIILRRRWHFLHLEHLILRSNLQK